METEPAPVESRPPRRGRFVRFLGRLVVYWMIYTLSIGPFFWAWFEASHVDGPKWIARFYTPLLYACEVFPWFGAIVNAYIDWWILK
jgi:hypothetical protein